MALGDIWLAGADGTCDQAGTCPDGGPCGDGEIIDCPPDWESIQSLEIDYTPGSPFFLGGRNMAPGESLLFLRGDEVSEIRPYSYPVEIFKAGAVDVQVNFDDIPVGVGSNAFTLSGLTGVWVAFNGLYQKTAAGEYTNVTIGKNAKIKDSSGLWRMESPAGTLVGYTETVGYSFAFSVPEGLVIWRTPPISNDLTNWLPMTAQSMTTSDIGYNTSGQPAGTGVGPWPYFKVTVSNSSQIYWTTGASIWGTTGGLPTGSGSALIYYDNGSGGVAGKNASYADPAPVTPDEYEAFWNGGFQAAGTIAYEGGYTPPMNLPAGILDWQIEERPFSNILLPATEFDDIPEEASALTENLFWNTKKFVDRVTLVAYPNQKTGGSVSVTVRSACVEPPP